MSIEKQRLREQFRNLVFERDGSKCVICNKTNDLDAHHITDRRDMPAGGYVLENGISLCPEHHQLAEIFHSTGKAHLGFSPEDLYDLVGSNHYQAYQASVELEVSLDRRNK